jgi:hypothetical protein
MLDSAKDPAVKAALHKHADFYVVRDGPTYGERVARLADRLTSRGDAKDATSSRSAA